MICASLNQIAQVLQAKLQGADCNFTGVSTDSRSVKGGELFIALVGEQFDGHEFAVAAQKSGAAALLLSRTLEINVPQLIVSDTHKALGDLARWWRDQSTAQVIALTGSNGKTSVKAMTANILSQMGSCHANAGNFNNEIGLPVSLLRMPLKSERVVLEMGAGQPGDIAHLCDIAKPTIALVNNIGPAHLERMGSLQGIAETKGAIYSSLPKDGIAVINADDTFADYFRGLVGSRKAIEFGMQGNADVSARVLSADENSSLIELQCTLGATEVRLPFPGVHNVYNAMAAAALSLAAGAHLDAIKRGLQTASAVAGRLQISSLANNVTLIDDSYNANPSSVRAAIETLAQRKSPRMLVLGDMRELGESAAQLHAQVGEVAKQAGIESLLTVGELSAHTGKAFGSGAQHFADQAELIVALKNQLSAGSTVLIKGSRGSRMDLIVAALRESQNNNNWEKHHVA